MTEKEAVIRVKTGNFRNNYGFDMQLLIDAVGTLGEMFRNGKINETATILNEQEAVKPDYDPTTMTYSCGNCGQPFDRCKYKFCSRCGRKVK